jgi:hypothetical protein
MEFSKHKIEFHVTNINLSTSWNLANIKSDEIRQADVTPITNFWIIWLGEFLNLELSPLNGIFP